MNKWSSMKHSVTEDGIITETIWNDEYLFVDKDIREIIKLLNKKGYETQFCCAGHNTSPVKEGYILFTNRPISDLPTRFYFCEESESIRWKFEDSKTLKETHIKLKEYVDGLPQL